MEFPILEVIHKYTYKTDLIDTLDVFVIYRYGSFKGDSHM